jgi:hypothetical protein
VPAIVPRCGAHMGPIVADEQELLSLVIDASGAVEGLDSVRSALEELAGVSAEAGSALETVGGAGDAAASGAQGAAGGATEAGSGIEAMSTAASGAVSAVGTLGGELGEAFVDGVSGAKEAVTASPARHPTLSGTEPGVAAGPRARRPRRSGTAGAAGLGRGTAGNPPTTRGFTRRSSETAISSTKSERTTSGRAGPVMLI